MATAPTKQTTKQATKSIFDKFSIGERCQIYSDGQQQWFDGEVVGISKDTEGEWLKVQYAANIVKEIAPTSEHIRFGVDAVGDAEIEHMLREIHRGDDDDKKGKDGKDEKEENEEKHEAKEEKEADADDADADDSVDWAAIVNALQAKKTSYVKGLLSSRSIGVNAQNPRNGKTLLIYAVVIGDMDLVKGRPSLSLSVSQSLCF